MKVFQILVACWLGFFLHAAAAKEKRFAFIVCGDPQYHAEKAAAPQALDPYSEQAMSRFIGLASAFAGREIPSSHGGGKVSEELLGMIVTGDLVDSADKNGGHYPAMQKFEWERYKSDFGLKGKGWKAVLPRLRTSW